MEDIYSVYGRHIFSIWKIYMNAKKVNNNQKAKSVKRDSPI